MDSKEIYKEYAIEFFRETGPTFTNFLNHYIALRAYGMQQAEAMDDVTIEMYSFLEQVIRNGGRNNL